MIKLSQGLCAIASDKVIEIDNRAIKFKNIILNI